jgi:3'(2'), 5'-bisphosphate nucleotidase
MTDADLLDLACRLAMEGGEVVLAARQRGVRADEKEDRSPVTEADRAAERLILAALREATPAIPVIAEEEVAAGRAPAAGETFWLVDPLDGTREFVKGLDHFTVNIGLVRAGRPVLGAVAAPVFGALFYGGPALGAFRRDARGISPLRVAPPPAAGLRVIASRHHDDPARLAELLAPYQVSEIAHFGSALKFCRLAEGRYDFYPRLGPTMEWDTAGPQAVLEGAGGRVLTLEGAPLRYGKPGFRNPPFLAWGGAAP